VLGISAARAGCKLRRFTTSRTRRAAWHSLFQRQACLATLGHQLFTDRAGGTADESAALVGGNEHPAHGTELFVYPPLAAIVPPSVVADDRVSVTPALPTPAIETHLDARGAGEALQDIKEVRTLAGDH